MADFPGGGRRYALSFGIGQYGYLGTGYDDNYQKDFYRFDPSAGDKGEWTLINGFGGQKRQGGQVFVIDDIAYICGGENNNSDVTEKIPVMMIMMTTILLSHAAMAALL